MPVCNNVDIKHTKTKDYNRYHQKHIKSCTEIGDTDYEIISKAFKCNEQDAKTKSLMELNNNLNEAQVNAKSQEDKINELLKNVEIIKQLEDSLKCSKDEKETESSKKVELEIQCKSLNEKIVDLEGNIQELNKSISDLRTSKSDSNAQLESLTNEISAKNEEMTSSQVTTILDRLLFESGYDRQIRPQINGPPVHVNIF